ncbi:MAG: AMP-binding protein [Rhodocyclaceae bacterium]
MDRPLWQPDPAAVARTRLTAFTRQLEAHTGQRFSDYADLHRWSTNHAPAFWSALWDFAAVMGDKGARIVEDGERMPGARWFPDARLNFARNLLRQRGPGDAIVFRGEDKVARRLSHDSLHAEVARLAAALRAQGVEAGDRVAAYLPNMPETLIAMLATASIGAIFSSASPDFGVQGVLDRFGQIEPKILIAADGAFYGGKRIDNLPRVADVAARLPSLRRVVIVPYVSEAPVVSGIAHGVVWRDFVAPFASVGDIEYADMPFDAPLYILFSSGTTGVPKCIVHGAGGTLLQHMKEHQLHSDVRAGDRVFHIIQPQVVK